MNSLRNRFAAILILAIVSVVGLATLAATRALSPPEPARTLGPVAEQIIILAHLSQQDRNAAISAGVDLRDTPAEGEKLARLSQTLTGLLSQYGMAATAIVTQTEAPSAFVASVDLGSQGWLISAFPDMRPPPGGWKIFAGWLVLITLGATAVSLYAAARVTGPLRLLEGAVQRIDLDGTLTPLPETGPAETRAAAGALNQLSARLKSAMESRMRLVAAAGHDLRTPMTRMRLRAEFIEDDEERGKWLSDLEELDTIADSAIRLVREEVSRDSEEPVRLDRMLLETATELAALSQKITVTRLDPLTVMAGPFALKRALRNLISNAATHGGGATISLSRGRAEAQILITDEGPGIPEALIEQVFEPFFRVDIARRKTLPGAGLGLAIAKEIIERFHGKIDISNRDPQGLSQTVTLPLWQGQRPGGR